MRFKVQIMQKGQWNLLYSFYDLQIAKQYFEQMKSAMPRENLRLADKGGELAIYFGERV